METERSSGTLTRIAVLSALGLFVEMLLIRWLDSQVRPLLFVKNLPLIASFLGLGIGYATPGRRRALVPLSALLVVACLGAGLYLNTNLGAAVRIGPEGPESNLGVRLASSGAELALFYGIVAGLFALVALAMVPIGQVTAEAMEATPALVAYTANIAGSLAGVLLFFLLAAFSAPPWLSAAVALLVLVATFRLGRLVASLSVVAGVLVCLAMAAGDTRSGVRTTWSPYNKIEVVGHAPIPLGDGRSYQPGPALLVQNLYYQQVVDLSREAVEANRGVPFVRERAYQYNYPYTWYRPETVLVVGAGTGNDVAAALRAGVRRVDAVEIDPKIIAWGRELHPERPYDDPRVHQIADDARAYLRRDGPRYDMIVFGMLDSHTSFFSSLTGSIRLDNYVYTVEAFRQALARLEPDGMIALSFAAEHSWRVSRLAAMMEEAEGRPPLVTRVAEGTFTILAGPRVEAPTSRPEVSRGTPAAVLADNPPGPTAHDDWPFLYLRGRTIPRTVLVSGAGIVLVTVVLVVAFFRGATRFDRHFFFLGAGFLLLETRTIAQLALLYGVTWRVSAIAIAAILLLILIANLAVRRLNPLPAGALYAGLGLALVANAVVPVSSALGRGALAGMGMTALLALPLLFAALVFASSVRSRGELSPVLASNLVGSVLGGLLENGSLLLGISSLSLVALAVYAASYRRFS